MKKMPARDTSGKCKGECRNRVLEGEKERQSKIDSSKIGYSTGSTTSPPWTRTRNAPPGWLDGHV